MDIIYGRKTVNTISELFGRKYRTEGLPSFVKAVGTDMIWKK